MTSRHSGRSTDSPAHLENTVVRQNLRYRHHKQGLPVEGHKHQSRSQQGGKEWGRTKTRAPASNSYANIYKSPFPPILHLNNVPVVFISLPTRISLTTHKYPVLGPRLWRDLRHRTPPRSCAVSRSWTWAAGLWWQRPVPRCAVPRRVGSTQRGRRLKYTKRLSRCMSIKKGRRTWTRKAYKTENKQTGKGRGPLPRAKGLLKSVKDHYIWRRAYSRKINQLFITRR